MGQKEYKKYNRKPKLKTNNDHHHKINQQNTNQLSIIHQTNHCQTKCDDLCNENKYFKEKSFIPIEQEAVKVLSQWYVVNIDMDEKSKRNTC